MPAPASERGLVLCLPIAYREPREPGKESLRLVLRDDVLFWHCRFPISLCVLKKKRRSSYDTCEHGLPVVAHVRKMGRALLLLFLIL